MLRNFLTALSALRQFAPAGAVECPLNVDFGTSGHLEVVAGELGRAGGIAGSGPYGALSLLRLPKGVAVDPVAQQVYISDSGNHVVRSIGLEASSFEASVRAETLAGTLGRPGGSGDLGMAKQARLRDPHGLAIDAAARRLYVADAANHVVRAVDLTSGAIVTVAGTMGLPGSAGDRGRAAKAQLHFPTGLALDVEQQRLYVADSRNHAIRAVELVSGVITTIAGELGVAGATVDGESRAAKLHTPLDVAFDPAGFLYVSDSGNHAVHRIELAEGEIRTSDCRCTLSVETIAGGVGESEFAKPSDLSLAGRRILGGAGRQGRDHGPALDVRLRHPSGLAFDNETNVLYVADSGRPAVLRLNLTSGEITTAAHRPGFYDKRSEYGGMVGLALDSQFNALYMAETLNHVVRRLELGADADVQSSDACLPPDKVFRSRGPSYAQR